MIRQSLVLLIVVATTILGWRLLDGQIDAANVEGPLHGVTYDRGGVPLDVLTAVIDAVNGIQVTPEATGQVLMNFDALGTD